MSKLILGAPSLTGKDANELVSAQFGSVSYPAKFRFTNLIFMALSFPEISGLYLKPVGHDGEESVVVTIKDGDAMQRLASSIEQIAELNGKEELLEIELFDEAAEAAAAEAAKAAEAEELAKAQAEAEADEAESKAIAEAEAEKAAEAAEAAKAAAAGSNKKK